MIWTLILLRWLWRLSRIAGDVLPILTLTGSSSSSLSRMGIVRWRHTQSPLRLLPRRLPPAVILTLSPQFVGKLVNEALLAAVFDWCLAVLGDVSAVLAAHSSSGGISTTVLGHLYLEDIVPPSQTDGSCARYESTRADKHQRCEPHLGFSANVLRSRFRWRCPFICPSVSSVELDKYFAFHGRIAAFDRHANANCSIRDRFDTVSSLRVANRKSG